MTRAAEVATLRQQPKQGNAIAQASLGVMYRNGQGISQDAVLLMSGVAGAQTSTGEAFLLQYECSGFKGMYMGAPAWTPDYRWA